MGVDIDGLAEVMGDMKKAKAGLERMALTEVAREAVETMAPMIPVRSGRLRKSLRTGAPKAGKAVVRAGSAKLPYAPVILYGSKVLNIASKQVIERTDQHLETVMPDLIERAWEEIARESGLTT